MQKLRTIFLTLCLLCSSSALTYSQDIKSVQDYGYASSLFERGLYRIAIDAFENFVFNNPESPLNGDARFHIGKAYFELEEFESAQRAFEEVAIKHKASPLNHDAWNYWAQCYTLLGETQKAAETYEAIADILFAETRYTVPALYRAADLYAGLNNVDRSLGLLFRIIDNYPEHQLYSSAIIRLSSLYADRGDYLKAIRELTRLENSSVPEHVKWEAQYYRGLFELKVNSISKGERTLNALISSSPQDSSVHLKAVVALARSYQSAKRYEDAGALLMAISNRGNQRSHLYGETLLRLGINHRHQKSFNEAQSVFDDALPLLEPSSTAYRECLYYAAKNALDLEDTNKAFSYLSTLFDNNWLSASGVMSMAGFEYEAFALYLRTANLVNKPVDAALYSNAILTKSGIFEDAQMFLKWGDLFSAASMTGTANELYETGYSRFPSTKGSDFLLFNRAGSYELFGIYGKAVSMYNEVITKYPGGEAAAQSLERIEYIGRKYSLLTPEEIMQRRLDLSGKLLAQNQDVNSAYLLGRLQYDLRHYPDALDNFNKVIEAGETAGNYGEALRYTGQIHDNLHHIYSFEDSGILATRAARDAVRYYSEYVDHSENGKLNESIRKRIIDLNVALIEDPHEKIDWLRNLAGTGGDPAEQAVADHGRMKLAEAIISHAGVVDSVSEALSILEEIRPGLTGEPLKENAAYLTVLASLAGGNNPDVIQSSRRYVTEYPYGAHTPEVRFIGAKALVSMDDTATAKAWIGDIKERYYYSAYSDSTAVLEADILAKEGKSEEAIELYREQLANVSSETDPFLIATLLRKSGEAYAGIRDFETAVDHFTMYIETTGDPKEKIEGYKALAQAYKNNNDLDNALNSVREIIELNSDSTETLNARIEEANILFEMADNPLDPQYDEKLRRAQSAFSGLSLMPFQDSVKARFEFDAIVTLYRLDRRQEANDRRKEFKKKYENLPRRTTDSFSGLFRVEEGAVHQRRAVTLLSTANQQEADDRFDNAEAIFIEIIKDYPFGVSRQLAEYYLGLQMAAYQDRIQEGLPLLMTFRTKYPDSPYLFIVYNQLGSIFFQLENYKDAFLAFDTAINTPKGMNDIRIHRIYIEACERAGFPQSQLDALHTYLRHFPTAPDRMDRLIRIGSLYKELGQFDIAVSHFKEILAKADPAEQIEIQYQIGDCFYQMERFTIAIAEYMKILEYGDPASVKLPFHTNARWYIALSFESIGQYDNAINYLDKIIARYSSADPFHRKAMREKEKIENIMKKR